MRQGRRLIRSQKVLLKNQGFDWKDFLFKRETAEFIDFIQKSTGKILTIRW